MKTSTILEIKSVKPYLKGQHGPVYYYTMVLQNGETVNIGKKSESAFQLGDEIKYVIVEPADEYGIIKIRHPKPEEDMTPSTNPAGGTTYKGNSNIASFALSYSKDLAVGGKIELDAILPIADKFYEWLSQKI